MMKKILIAHDFNLDLKMYKLDKNILNKNKFIKKSFKIKNFDNLSKTEKLRVKIFWGNRLNIKIINQLKNLKYVHFGSKGVNEDLSKYLKKKKIKYTNTKKIFVKPMVSSILSSIFASSRGINISYFLRQNKKNDRKNADNFNDYMNNVYDENFLLVGFGEINKKLLNVLKLFSKNISIINRSIIINKNIKKFFYLTKLNQAVKNQKFIINTLPLTNETKNIFDKKVFKNFKKNSIFINYGRGDTVNFKDLKKYAKLKKLVLCLDVFNSSQYVNPYKPIKKNYYFSNKFLNIITPHIGAYDKFYWEKQIDLFSKNVRKFIHVIN